MVFQGNLHSFLVFTQCRMVVSYRNLGQHVCLSVCVPSSRVKQSKKNCFLLDIPEDLALMFSLIAVSYCSFLPIATAACGY